jgi:hypothetical protein
LLLGAEDIMEVVEEHKALLLMKLDIAGSPIHQTEMKFFLFLPFALRWKK